MNNAPELNATDCKPNPPPSPPPLLLTDLKPTAVNGEYHHFDSTIDLNSESDSESKKDKENDDRHFDSTVDPNSESDIENKKDKGKDEESFSCSSSYSSSDSDSDSDFFQINPPELSYPPPSPTTGVNLNTDGIEKIPSPNREKNSGLGIERRPPVVQSMPRDPNRIPSSIFSRGPMTPMEWSMASNESLFSIHMGNTSFSKDHIFLTGRSGELRGFAGGTTDYPSPWISPDLRSVAAVGGVGRREMGDAVVEVDEAAAASANAEAMREVMRAAAEGRESEKKVMLGRSISRHSDGSTTSFAFPILTGDGRVGSIKVNFEHHRDDQLNPQIKPSKIFDNKAPTAAMRPHHPAHAQGPASVQRKWFPCFSCCKFRFCCYY